jgi:hypothetical protein
MRSRIILDAKARRAIGLRNPGYTAKRKVGQAEKFATEVLGVASVDYGGDLEIANTCNRAILAMKQRGVLMPAALKAKGFRVQDGDDPDDIAVYVAGTGNNPGEIFLNLDHPAWREAAVLRQAYRDGLISTGDKHHPIIHEMGELALHQSVGLERFDPLHESYLAEEEEFQALGDELDELADLVSEYATNNHSEFVAEVFTALMLGRDELKQNARLMALYEHFGGPDLRRYDRETSA